MNEKKIGKLSETELDVMKSVWELAAPITVSRLLEVFEESKGWKISTLSTLLARLIEKGFLTKRLDGKVNIYSPLLSLEEYRNYETRTFMKKVHGGSIKSFIAAFADDENITLEEISELKHLLDEKGGL